MAKTWKDDVFGRKTFFQTSFQKTSPKLLSGKNTSCRNAISDPLTRGGIVCAIFKIQMPMYNLQTNGLFKPIHRAHATTDLVNQAATRGGARILRGARVPRSPNEAQCSAPEDFWPKRRVVILSPGVVLFRSFSISLYKS